MRPRFNHVIASALNHGAGSPVLWLFSFPRLPVVTLAPCFCLHDKLDSYSKVQDGIPDRLRKPYTMTRRKVGTIWQFPPSRTL